jgi:hypothetical protein
MTRLSALFSLLVMLLAASFSRPVDAQVATGAPPIRDLFDARPRCD